MQGDRHVVGARVAELVQGDRVWARPASATRHRGGQTGSEINTAAAWAARVAPLMNVMSPAEASRDSASCRAPPSSGVWYRVSLTVPCMTLTQHPSQGWSWTWLRAAGARTGAGRGS